MTIGGLRELLEDLDALGASDDVEVKLALQPNYPMVGSIMNFCIEKTGEDDVRRVWIACSDNEAYGCPRDVWDEREIWHDEEEEG